MNLIVIIRDPSPLVHFGDAVEHRHVVIELTDEQVELLRLRWMGNSGEKNIYEQVATCFLEGEPPRQMPPERYR